ncbi:hypothetical protein DY000_02033615 [Brassica cretica]|uniref:PGG domain-containing protein n=1 Tax=Brassica cretica TaxID=69181 RepID=A0ABQ7DTA6_BRACR|nr:hypothetical protein DY000_02033615 [Brassica cretica]
MSSLFYLRRRPDAVWDSFHHLKRSAVLHGVINRATDGGIKPLHVAALKRHIERMQLLLDLGAFVAHITGRWNPN